MEAGIALASLWRMPEPRTPTWDDVRRIADELQLKIHLASMDVRTRWNELQPRLAEVEKTIAREGERAGKFVAAQVSSLGEALRELRDEIQDKLETHHKDK
jgi:hypothetical protein